jgi:DNA polymerase
MDNAIRLQYLEAMGIESWTFQHPPAPVLAPALEMPVVEFPAGVMPTSSHSDLTGFKNLSGLAQPIIEPIRTASHLEDWQSSAPPVVEPEMKPVIAVPDNWQTLQNEVAQCRNCSLCETRKQTVFGTGNQQADWLFIGEAPGEQEDLQGQPFVGPAGALLTEMIRAIGLSRDRVFIANILKCRPPQNRDPKVQEILACQSFLHRQIALIQPKIIIAVGRIAAQHLLNTTDTLGNLRGKVYQYHNIPLLVVYHPAYLLRSLPQKRKAWQDLQLAIKTYQSMTGE